MKTNIKILCIMIIAWYVIPSSVVAQTKAFINAKYEKVEKLIEFAKDVEASFPNLAARNLLIEAQKLLQNAKDAILSDRLILANRQLDSASLLINDALRLILNNPINRQREKVKELLQYAEPIVVGSGNRKAEHLLKQAKYHQAKALESYQNRQYQLTLEHFRLAQFLANKAIDLAGNHDLKIKDRASDERERLQQLLKRAKQAVDESQNLTAEKFYQLAEKQIHKTQRELDNQNYVKAIDHYHKATRLLLRAMDIASGKNEKLSVRLYDEVANLDELIETLQSKLEVSGLEQNSRLDFLMDRILDFQQSAHQALEDKDHKAVLFNIQMTHNLIERASLIIERKADRHIESSLGDEIQQLEVMIEEISFKVRQSKNEEAKELLNLSITMKNRAQNLNERGNQRLALGAVAIASRFASSAEQLIVDPEYMTPTENIVRNNLERIDNMLRKLRAEIQQTSTIEKVIFDEAEKMYQQANTALNKGYLNLANECLQIAQRYLEKIKQKGE